MDWQGIVGIVGLLVGLCAIAGFFISRKNAAKDDGAREEKLRASEEKIKDHEARIREMETKIMAEAQNVKKEVEQKLAIAEEKEAANYKELRISMEETQRLISSLSGIMERIVAEVGEIRRDVRSHIVGGDDVR